MCGFVCGVFCFVVVVFFVCVWCGFVCVHVCVNMHVCGMCMWYECVVSLSVCVCVYRNSVSEKVLCFKYMVSHA